MDGEHRRDPRAPRPAERRAVKEVEPARGPRQDLGIPESIPENAGGATRAPEREELEVDAGPVAKRRDEPADVPSGTRTRLDQRGDVDPDPHAETPSRPATCRRAVRGSGYSRSSTARAASHQR